MKRFSEQFQLNDLDRHAVSDMTADWLYDRQTNGIDDFSLKNLKIDKTSMLLTFTASSSHVIGHSVTNVSVDGKDVQKKGYTTQISFMNPEEFLGDSQSFTEFSEREQDQLLEDYINEGMAKVHCTCKAWYNQAHWESMSSHDSSIYKFPGPKGTGVWRSRHTPGLSDPGITICKHIASVIEQIHEFRSEILSLLISKTWNGSIDATTPIEKTVIASVKPEPIETDVEKEPVLDTPDMQKDEPEEIVEPSVAEEPEEEVELDLPAGEEPEKEL